MSDEMMGVPELAKYLGFHEMTMYRMLKRGVISPMKKVGGRWRARKSDIDAWFDCLGNCQNPSKSV